MKKKILSMMLALSLCAGMLSAQTKAAEEEIEVEKETEVLSETTGIPEEISAAEKPEGQTVSASSASGSCGENLTWTLDDEGTLVISGEGAMYDYGGDHWDSNSIVTVIIENGVTSIGDSKFFGCSSLTSVNIPDSVTSIGWWAFSECSSLKDVSIRNGVIKGGAFSECSSLLNVSLENGVTSIGTEAFYGCDSLTSITFPESLINISTSAFYGCGSLTEFIVDENNPYYSSRDGVLFNKEQTVLLQYPVGNESVSYQIPSGVQKIEGYMFEHDAGMYKLYSGGFANCMNLVSIILPDSVISIEEGAFFGCKGLTEMRLPDSVASIGREAFCACSSLNQVSIGSGVTNIEKNAFCACNNLTEIIVDKNNCYYSSIDGVLFNKEQTDLIQYPVGKLADSYNVPNGVENIYGELIQNGYLNMGNISDGAYGHWYSYGGFSNCTNLTSITFPDSLKNIRSGAFYGCGNLKEIYFSGEAPKLDYNYDYSLVSSPFSFGGTDKIYYPSYKKGWKELIDEYNSYNESGFQYVTWVPIETPFTDVNQSSWYYSTVKEAYELGLMTGTTSTIFAPNSPMTRAMATAVLYRISGSPAIEYEPIFSDVADGKYYSKCVTWAAKNKIVNGYAADNTFRPNANVTREQMAVILYNYAKFRGLDVSVQADLSSFNDASQISSYARTAMSWAVGNKLMSGTLEGNLNPKNEATRAECAKMLLQTYKLIEGNG